MAKLSSEQKEKNKFVKAYEQEAQKAATVEQEKVSK